MLYYVQLDLILIHSACWQDVTTGKAENEITKIFFCTLSSEYHTWSTKWTLAVTKHERSCQLKRCHLGLPELLKRRLWGWTRDSCGQHGCWPSRRELLLLLQQVWPHHHGNRMVDQPPCKILLPPQLLPSLPPQNTTTNFNDCYHILAWPTSSAIQFSTQHLNLNSFTRNSF